ncbi:MAG: GTPase RsgA, partial [Kamptonema sp. SIO4C4]|nr:GTPase RsgA [Kamptonema sp. SIO4C4]
MAKVGMRRKTRSAKKSLAKSKKSKLSLLDDSYSSQAIASNAEIARTDYQLLQEELQDADNALRDLERSLTTRLGKITRTSNSARTSEAQKIALQPISEIYQRLTEKRATDLNDLRDTLQAKKRSLGNFTITMMGRTKAGKSTLFATLLGESYERIGSGKQRTTRKNRPYELDNGIRLIDTPGIAAVGGEADEAEALKAVE